MASATTVAGYQSALEGLAAASFKESAAAQRIVEQMPDDKRQRAFILFRGDLTALATSENLPAGGFPKPSAAIQIDRDVINNLQTDSFLNEIWQIRWSMGGKTTDVISKGELEKKEDGRYSGHVEPYPKYSGVVPDFEKEVSIPSGVKFIQNEPSSTIQLMNSLGLAGLLDPTGTEYLGSVIPLIDRIFNNQRADPLAKACVLNQLFGLLRSREIEWGLHLIPELQDDMEAAKVVQVKGAPISSDWLLTERPDWADLWSDYFRERSSRDYYSALRHMLDIIRATRDQPVVLAGKVDADGRAHFDSQTEGVVVWSLSEAADGGVSLQVLGEGGKGLIPLAVPESVLPFSPLFGFAIRSDDKRRFILKMHGVVPNGSTVED